ncbi:hypothetical protein HYY71_02155 [Candidatus Woesearchaeota archaeon]|nr:hypothetical protein [Candidatus Woesearchaeota archaeon]
MKTVYTNELGFHAKHLKVVVPDETLSLAERGVQEIGEIFRKELWLPSLEIRFSILKD